MASIPKMPDFPVLAHETYSRPNEWASSDGNVKCIQEYRPSARLRRAPDSAPDQGLIDKVLSGNADPIDYLAAAVISSTLFGG